MMWVSSLANQQSVAASSFFVLTYIHVAKHHKECVRDIGDIGTSRVVNAVIVST